MATFDRQLESAAGEEIHARGTRFNFVSGTADVRVRINGKSNVLSPGQGLVLADVFESVWVESTADQAVRFFIGTEEFTDARLVGDVNSRERLVKRAIFSRAYETPADDSCLEIGFTSYAGYEQVSLVLKNLASNNAGIVVLEYDDSADVDREFNGWELAPGESLSININGILYVRNTDPDLGVSQRFGVIVSAREE